MPGRTFANNGRISRNEARIGSSIATRSRRTAFQSIVISGSGARGRSADLMELWLTDCEFPFPGRDAARSACEALLRRTGIAPNTTVIAGLDPAIHPLRTIFLKRDGCAGQARA